jgi:hypothetical protein
MADGVIFDFCVFRILRFQMSISAIAQLKIRILKLYLKRSRGINLKN